MKHHSLFIKLIIITGIFLHIVYGDGIEGLPEGSVVTLPDIIIDEDTLHDNRIENPNSSTKLFRFSNATANIGEGNLEIEGTGITASNGNEIVNQRVYAIAPDGSRVSYTRAAGEFEFHPTHGHVHFTDWTEFRLREVVWLGDVGDTDNAIPGNTMRTGNKTSFCLIDLQQYSHYPNRPPSEYTSCGTRLQGITRGWMDIYSSNLDGQSIDITGLADGTYFFEVEVNPDGNALEMDYSNNLVRILVTFNGNEVNSGSAPGGGYIDDRYEPNDSIEQVQLRSFSSVNSPNIPVANGTHINPGDRLMVSNLTVGQFDTNDYFRFYSSSTGTSSDWVRISGILGNDGSPIPLPDVDMELYKENTDQSVTLVDASVGVEDQVEEVISLEGLTSGWYIIRIIAVSSETGIYDLTIKPPDTSTIPEVVLINPSSHDSIGHGHVYTVNWSASDSDSNPLFVNLCLNSAAEFDGNEIWVPAPVNLDGAFGSWNVNTALFEEGTYNICLDVNNGGQRVRTWSNDTLEIFENPVSGYIRDAQSGLPVSGAQVHFIGASEHESDTAVSGSDGFYEIGLHAGDYDVYVTASGYPESVHVSLTVPGTNTLNFSLHETPAEVTVIFDDFETDLGWITDFAGTDTATTGDWERANPQATASSGSSMQLDTTVSGSFALVTGPLAGTSVGTHDIDSGVTSVRSPTIQLPSTSPITLSVSYYFAHLSNASSADFFRISIIGATTSVVLEELGSGTVRAASWEQFSTEINEFSGQNISILLEAADNSSGSLVEAGVDDLLITAPLTNSPPEITNPGNQVNDEGEIISLSITADDADGNVLVYTASGLPPDLSINANTGVISGTLTQAGNYAVTISVDDSINSVSAAFTWTVNAVTVNQPPSVNAGIDQVITVVETISLDATVIDDGLPSPPATVTTLWTKVSGAGAVTFGNASHVDTTASFSEADTYVLRLTANDGALETTDDLTVEVNPDTSSGIFEARIIAPDDDAEERESGSMYVNSSDLEFVQDGGGNQLVGLRYGDVQIPPNALITNAYLQFTVDESTSIETTLLIQGEKTVDPTSFASNSGNISSRPRTTASQPWTPGPWDTIGDAGLAQRTPDITSVIQEIVNQSGWASGNSMVFILSGTGERVAESYNGVPSSAPLLHVEYNTNTDHRPTIVLQDPSPGSNYIEGEAVQFTGSANDNEDGDITANIQWTSDRDGTIGTGGAFTRSNLSAGFHTITASVMDSAGQVATTEVDISVSSLDSVVLVGAGDIASCDNDNDEDTALLLDMIPGTVVTLGDSVYPDGTEEDFLNCYDPTWGRHKDRTLPAPGKREYAAPGAAGYFSYFGSAAGDTDKGYYSTDRGSWHIVVLNTNCDEVGGCESDSPQGQWLQDDLAANLGQCVLAIMHEPRFTSSSSPNAELRDFWQILYDAGADIVLSGDYHNYERFAPQDPDGNYDPGRGIRQFVVGTGGRGHSPFPTNAPNNEVKNSSTFGVLKLTLHPAEYDWEFIPVAGETFTDSGTSACVLSTTNQRPTTTIISPTNEASFNEGQAINFVATGTDPEDGDLGSTIEWESDIDGIVGTGADITVNTLSLGVHEITATATDSLGRVGLDEITLFVTDGGEGTTTEIRVDSGADDAEERLSGGLKLYSSDLELVLDSSGEQTVGIRFNNVEVPQGAIVSNAYIQFQADEKDTILTSLTIEGEASDNADQFVNTANNISLRQRTLESVTWNPPPWNIVGEAGPDQRTPDLAPVVQEIVNRVGWSAGNSLVMIVTGTGARVAESHDGDAAGAPLLHIEFQLP